MPIFSLSGSLVSSESASTPSWAYTSCHLSWRLCSVKSKPRQKTSRGPGFCPKGKSGRVKLVIRGKCCGTPKMWRLLKGNKRKKKNVLRSMLGFWHYMNTCLVEKTGNVITTSAQVNKHKADCIAETQPQGHRHQHDGPWDTETFLCVCHNSQVASGDELL